MCIRDRSGPLATENLFPVGDNARIVQRIVDLSNDLDLRLQIGREQRQVALQRFSTTQCCESLSRVYFSTLDR